jgi:hypothetical protein
VTLRECGISFWGDENVLKLFMAMVAQQCEYKKLLNSTLQMSKLNSI